MKNRSLLAAFWAGILVFGLSLPQQPGLAKDSNTTHTPSAHKRYNVQRSPYSRLEPYRSSDFVGQFPGSCAYDRAAGNCMIDLGYGRCMPCSAGPMK